MHAEEKVTKEKWTSAVTIGPGATGDSTEETIAGDSVVISAKSADPGTYSVSIKFTITFTIESPNTKREKPYSGVGLATLNVKNGIFEVKIKPDDNFHLFNGDTNGYRNKVGIGEVITICVFPEGGSNDTVVFDHVMFNGIRLQQTVSVGEFPRIIDFDVFAMINGTLEGPESIGVTVIEPTGVSFFRIPNGNIAHLQGIPSIGVILKWQILPTTVSFCNITTQEWGQKNNGETIPECDLFVEPNVAFDKQPHKPGADIGILPCKITLADNNYKKANVTVGADQVITVVSKKDYENYYVANNNSEISNFTLRLPWRYKVNGFAKYRSLGTIIQNSTIDKTGKTTIKKGDTAEFSKDLNDPNDP